MTNLQSFLDTVKQREFDVAETERLLTLTNINVWYSWGVSKIAYYNSSTLSLFVNANHHQGWVVVTLSFMDLYSYYLLNKDFTIKKEVHEVYFDELQTRIDKDIEFIDDYQF